MKNFFIKLGCLFVSKRKRNKIYEKYHFGYNLIVIENGKERPARLGELKNIRINGERKDNVIKISYPIGTLKMKISFERGGNTILLGKNLSGNWNLVCYEQDNYVKVGDNTSVQSFTAWLLNNSLIIGKDCMFSSYIRVWGGDAHAVLNATTKEVLNRSKNLITIGDHVWLGESVYLTKNAQIPDDCIVGTASVVTKKFTRKHCVLAGNPAEIKKENISWDKSSPWKYTRKENKK